MTAPLSDPRLSLRPETKLFGSAAVIATWTGFPLTVALYVIAIPAHAGGALLAFQILAMTTVAAAINRLRVAALTISDDGIRERGYVGRWHLSPTSKMHSVLIVDVLDPHSDLATRQLFVLNKSGKTLVRLRGGIWSNRSMQQVVRALDLPVRVLDEPLSIMELRRDHGAKLYWFERRPVLATFVCSIAAVALVSPLYLEFARLTQVN